MLAKPIRPMAFRNISNSTTEVVRSTKQLFDSFEFDQSVRFRALSPDSLQKGFQKFGAKLSNEEVDELFNLYDHDSNGKICLDEFFQLANSEVVKGLTFNVEQDQAPATGENTKVSRKALCVSKTDTWVEAVTRYKSAHLIASLFSADAILLGTISRTIRTQEGQGSYGIKEYFDYFAKLPGSQVVRREDNVVHVSEDVLVNNAMVYWAWEGEGAPTETEPLCARMTFVYRFSDELGDVELFELHSSALPAPKID